jgi:glycerol-3-phosphate dehydrogenase
MTGSPGHDIPVVIVGGGPVGLMLAIDLAQRGVGQSDAMRSKRYLASFCSTSQSAPEPQPRAGVEALCCDALDP